MSERHKKDCEQNKALPFGEKFWLFLPFDNIDILGGNDLVLLQRSHEII